MIKSTLIKVCMNPTSYSLETSDIIVSVELDREHPVNPLLEVKLVSADSLVAAEFHTNSQNLLKISEFFKKVATETKPV